jgi:hypothetical protein
MIAQFTLNKNNNRAEGYPARPKQSVTNLESLALTGLKARVGFVDDIHTALATDQLIVAVAFHQALEGIANFHDYTYMGGRKPPCSKSALSLAVQHVPVNHAPHVLPRV